MGQYFITGLPLEIWIKLLIIKLNNSLKFELSFRKAAREMNRKAFDERLRAIKMSEFESEVYEGYASQVRKQIQSLKNIINSLQAKAKDRQWLKNQTEGIMKNDSIRYSL